MSSSSRVVPDTYSSLTSTFSSFLTVTLHTLLHARRLYPKTTFLTARAYNFPVAQSRHPQVCKWIADAVDAVEAQMLRPNDNSGEIGGWIERVVFVIFSEKSEVMERWVFDMSRWLRVPRHEVDTEVVREAAPASDPDRRLPNRVRPAETDVDMAEQFRATLSQISNLSNRLRPLPPNCTFSLAIELSDQGDPPIGHPQAWIPVQPSLQRKTGEPNGQDGSGSRSDAASNSDSARGGDLGGTTSMPIRKVDAGEMVFELWVEEGRAKLDASPSSSADASTG